MGYALSDAPPLAYFVLNTYLDPPPQSRSPMGIACLVYVWVVWEKNFIELRRRIAVYQFNENGP